MIIREQLISSDRKLISYEIQEDKKKDGWYIVPEDNRIPKVYWGFRVSNKVISWQENNI